MQAAVKDGGFNVQSQGRPITDPEEAEEPRPEGGVHVRCAGAHRVDECGELEVLLADGLAGEDAVQRGKLGELARVQFIA